MKKGNAIFKNKKIYLIDILFYMIGLTSTWVAVQATIGSVQLSVYNILVLITVPVYLMNNKGIISFTKSNKEFGAYILITLVSLGSALIFLKGMWVNESIKATLKFLLLFTPFVFIFNKNKMRIPTQGFFKGLYHSCIVQAIWSFLQLFYWYALGRVLNQEIFGDLLKVETDHAWVTFHGVFRTTGLSWESANLGICMAVGFFLTNIPWMKIAFIVALIFSASRANIVAFVLTIVISFIKNKHSSKDLERFLKEWWYVIIIGIVFIVNMLGSNFESFMLLENSIDAIYSRFQGGATGSDSSFVRHLSYYLKIPEVYGNSNIIQILLGYGTSCSGYPYLFVFPDVNRRIAWNVESDVLTILIGNGIIGFIIYYLWYAKVMIRAYRTHNGTRFDILVCILLAGIMYGFLRSWVTFAVIFINYDSTLKSNNLAKNINPVNVISGQNK